MCPYIYAMNHIHIHISTNRAFANALTNNLGVAVVGPTASGKTETITDMAKAIAKQCTVFNAVKDLSVKVMGKISLFPPESPPLSCFSSPLPPSFSLLLLFQCVSDHGCMGVVNSHQHIIILYIQKQTLH